MPAEIRLPAGGHDGAFPRIKVVREPRGEGAFLGPFGTSRIAPLAKDALENVFPIRRCTRPMRGSTRFTPCVLADISRCTAPCDGRIDPERYGELVRSLVSSLSSPGGLLEALEGRMQGLARAERYEEAAALRYWIVGNPPRIEGAEHFPAEPVDGGSALHSLLARLRAAERPLEGAHERGR